MAVVTETGTATDPVNLLDKFRAFALAQGITIDQYRLDPGNADNQLLSLNFGSGFFSIAYDNSAETFILTQATGYIDGEDFGDQPNETPSGSTGCRSNFVSGSITEYHFFYNAGGLLICTFLMDSGKWSHFAVGDIVKYGTYVGGSVIIGNYIAPGNSNIDNPFAQNHSYFGHGSRDDKAVRLRVDNTTSPQFYTMDTTFTLANRGYMSSRNSTYSNGNIYINANPSSTTQATTLNPIQFFVEGGPVANRLVPVGELSDLRIINMRFFNAGDIFDDDWKVFPVVVKRDPDIRDNELNSGFIGVAIRFQNG